MSASAVARIRQLEKLRDQFAPEPDEDESDPRPRWRDIARPEQLAPDGPWRTWLYLAGRGAGKSRAGSEWVCEIAERNPGCRIALVGRTSADVRSVMLYGDSGIMSCARKRPEHEPSKRLLTFANGSICETYSADEPDQLRGPQHHYAWADELAAWTRPDAWTQLQMGLRLGQHPRVFVSTTPRPTPLIRELLGAKSSVITRGRTRDNARNLAASYLEEMERRYGGTRLGRQELEGEVLDDTPGALFRQSLIDAARVDGTPQLQRVVVAIDPAVTSGEASDETGIIVAGRDAQDHYYVLADGSGRYAPEEWARVAVRLHAQYEADAIVAEVNQGGDMVEHCIRQVSRSLAYVPVRATRGKAVRAEPISMMYEQGRVHHMGAFPDLEDQMCSWAPASSAKSPDRMDALVWAVTSLTERPARATVAEDYEDFQALLPKRRDGIWPG